MSQIASMQVLLSRALLGLNQVSLAARPSTPDRLGCVQDCVTEALSNLCVLVVDDSPVYRKLVEHALEHEPYSPVFAKNGREALELYAKHVPSIVVTDIEL